MEKDPYRLLEISRQADLSEIKRAYRRLVRRYHPDVCGRNMKNIKRFLEIKDAYALLTSNIPDPFGTAYKVESREILKASASLSEGHFRDGAFLFKRVDALKCLHGAETQVEVSDREEFCPRCRGLGATVSSFARPCPHCSGAGFKLIKWSGEDLKVVCSRCSGTGAMETRDCSMCRGSGKVVRCRKVKFRIPRGTRSGTVLELKGQGPWDPGQKCRTSLYVEVEAALPENMEIRGRDIVSPLKIDSWTYLGGGYVECRTIDGRKEVFIHPEAVRGGRLVLNGCGWIDERGLRGDHIFLIEVSYPKGPCPRKALEHLEALKKIWPAKDPDIKALAGWGTSQEKGIFSDR